eukprot:TRINITY_DN8402_c0_g3_i2.p1 TRINITY_DN8402_c0_g3~~TRINITY_DN8402_c0_g3_i2.p1  ORF type:complete len:257 (-),score=67.66 TRINITY_DN8402_c0_g3_i2:257-997(-)
MGDHHGHLNQEAQTYQDQYSQLQERLSEMVSLFSQTRQECDRLRTQIVPSPEKLKKSLAELAIAAETAKRENIQASTHTRDLQSKIEVLDKITNTLVKRVASMEEAHQELQKTKKLSKELKDLQEDIIVNEKAIQERVATEEHLKEQIESIYERNMRMKTQYEFKKRRVQQSLEELQQQRTTVMREQTKDRLKLQSTQSMVQRKQHEIKELKENHEQSMSHMTLRFEKLAQHLQHYHQSLSQAMTA